MQLKRTCLNIIQKPILFVLQSPNQIIYCLQINRNAIAYWQLLITITIQNSKLYLKKIIN